MSTETEILNLLVNGKAFSNPLIDIFDTSKNIINNINTNTLQTNIDIICNSIWPLNIPYPSEFTIFDKNNIDNIKSLCINTINDIIIHTNTLSGSIINGEKNIIALIDLTIAAKDTNIQWDNTKNINTHPLYEAASVFFLKKEIIENLNSNTTSLLNSYNFFMNTSDAILNLNTNYPIPISQKTKIRDEIVNIYSQISIINTYLANILLHDNTGWDSIQRKVYNKLFSIKLSSYNNANTELKEYFNIVGGDLLKKILNK